MTKETGTARIQRLIELEAGVHYADPPPPGTESFFCVARESRILISAPHGARTFRNSAKEIWHEEDEYTAAMALLIAEECETSVIATIWRSDLCDPNEHDERQCLYKQRVRQLVQEKDIRWLLDLHGAAENNRWMSAHELVDLGTRSGRSMDSESREKLASLIKSRLGPNTVSTEGRSASYRGRMTAFCQEQLHIQAIQIEMKASVRVAQRKADASVYSKLGPYRAPERNIVAVIDALSSFIRYLQSTTPPVQRYAQEVN